MKALSACAFFIFVALPFESSAQSPSSFTVDAYRQFLSTHQNLDASGLRALNEAGIFTATVSYDPSEGQYYDTISSYYSLTSDERSLFQSHGFVVSERLTYESFGQALVELFHRDLPVFVSTDAILHSMHMSYDVILKNVEVDYLIPTIDSLLLHMHAYLPTLQSAYGNTPGMRLSLRDVDVYLTVARTLLGTTCQPYYSENWSTVNPLLASIGSLTPSQYPLFSYEARTIDFSQFKVRGHYTDSEALGNYFRAMIWMGRTELYLTSPEVDGKPVQSDSSVQRQMIDSYLLLEALEGSGQLERLVRADNIIRHFVGESDNVTYDDLRTMRSLTGFVSADEMTDTAMVRRFQQTLTDQSFAGQRILSQIFITDPMSPDQIQTPSAFMIFGQRFVIDSYVTASVVYDRIVYNGLKVTRMLPSTLDILFALGNDGAAQLLEPELNEYHYGSNLAALRYLVDSYDQSFWTSTLYNAWLQSIRTLNPPADRSQFPAFMRTAAWWQQKMNTQLASWAELRHDNLLYAKQSYSGGIVCSFPESYVEPIPAFYRAVKAYAEEGITKLQHLGFAGPVDYFRRLYGVADTLESVAQKTLDAAAFSEAERAFLCGMIVPPGIMCGSPYTGWYPSLFYSPYDAGMFDKDFVVADIHTAPTNAAGEVVGWVVHAGTGPVNLAVISATLPGGALWTFVGPVMSYYEYLGWNFQRLSDEEWISIVPESPAGRAPFTDVYLADPAGMKKTTAVSLVTSAVETRKEPDYPATFVLMQNFPNPFNPSTVFEFSVPGRGRARLSVCDILGREVAVVFDGNAEAGRLVRVVFDASELSAGIYFATLEWKGGRAVRKIALMK